MLEYMYYLLWFTPIIIIILGIWEGSDSVDILWASSIFVVISVFVSIPVGTHYNQAAGNFGTIKAQAPIIRHYENYVDELNGQLDEIRGQGELTFTADTPVASLVMAKAEAQKNLLDARKAIDEAKLSLEQTRLGMFGFVVGWVEDKQKENN